MNSNTILKISNERPITYERPRGLRNRNPLNIRRSADRFAGEIVPSSDPAFKQFETNAYGYRAAFRILHTYLVKHRIDTLRGIIERFAPPEENDTTAYLRAVAQRAALLPDSRVRPSDSALQIRIVAAMSYVENGIPADLNEVTDGWMLQNERLR